MFEVFSVNLQHLINAEAVTDLSDTFKCPNCDCDAQYTLRAIDSNVRHKYFGRKKSTPHIPNCPYEAENYHYIDNDNLIKSDMADIFEQNFNNNDSYHTHFFKNGKSFESRTAKQYIRTSKQLFNYCISNSINTIYKNNQRISDIFIDERNICYDGNFKGKPGLYFILGKTYRYNLDSGSIEIFIRTKTQNNKNVSLNITIFLTEEHLKKIVTYIIDTFHTFAGHSIAVLGRWECDKTYHIQSTVTPQNVIYKFVDEV